MYFAFFILLSVFLHGKQTDGLYICLASYVISVRRTKSLLTASFRFHLTMDTLAVLLYTSSLPRRVRDFHPLERAHGAQTKRGISRSSENPSWLTVILFYCVGCAAAACAFRLARYSRAFMRSYSRCFSRFRARYSLEYCRW